MGLIKSKLSFFRLNSVYSSSAKTVFPFQRQILTFLKPDIKICRLFGVFPCVVVENHESKKLSIKSDRKWWLFYSILILLITSTYMVFQTGSLVICIRKGHSIVQLVAQSLWVNAGLVPYCVSIFMFISVDKLVGIFQAWCKIEMDLEVLFCHIKAGKHISNFRMTYLPLAAISTFVCGYHAIKQPNSPVYPFYYFIDNRNHTKVQQDGISNLLVYSYSIFQMLMIAWKWAGWAVIEGLCCLFATIFIQCSDSVMEGLEFVLAKVKDRGPEADDAIEAVLKSVIQDASNGEQDCIESSGKSRVPSKSTLFKRGVKSKGKEVASAMQQEEYLMFAIRNLQTFASLQSYINSVVGPLLLLDFGQLVLMTCALTFLPILFTQTLDNVAVIVFVGNWVTSLSRLVLLITCLGNVYTKGQEVNVGLAKAMNLCCLSPLAQSSVLAHLTVFSSNPVSFTAWGFFPITRGTLLAAFSLISTYAVVFLQLKV